MIRMFIKLFQLFLMQVEGCSTKTNLFFPEGKLPTNFHPKEHNKQACPWRKKKIL